jgi:hypothetical protein
MNRPAVALSSPIFLEELHHLFGTPQGRLPTGKADYGFNCYAKSFVVMYLCRLQGMAVDVCLGELFIMQKSIQNKYFAVVEPHAWVGSPKHRVIDLSIVDFEDHHFLPVYKDEVVGDNDWNVATTLKEAFFQEIRQNFRSLPGNSYMLYYLRKNRLFVFEDLVLGGKAANSPPTTALTSQYAENNVFAKAILHLHLFLEENRTSLRSMSRREAWDSLGNWRVEAVDELRKAMPHSQA